VGIRAKLLLPLLGLLLAVLGIGHFVAFDMLGRVLVAERQGAEQRSLQLVALAIVPDVLANDLGSIHESLDTIRQRHVWWHSVTLVAAGGNRLYPLAEAPPPPGLPMLDEPVSAAGTEIGRLRAFVDIESQVEPALAVLGHLEAASAALLVLGVLAVVWLQRRWFVVPLVGLAEASRQLSVGHYDTVLPDPSSGEVGGLIRSFDAMRRAVAERERALLDGERRLQAVIDNSAEAVLSLDGGGTILSVNRAAEAMFAGGAALLAGLGVDRLIEGFAQPAASLSEGREMEARGLDQRRFPVWVTAREARLGEDTIVVATVADLTERKRAEQQLKDSEERFRDLAVSASDWFWETDADNRLTFVSDRIGDILGVKPSAVRGFTYFDFGLGDYDPGLAQAHAEDLDAHRPFRDLTFPVGPDGAKDGKVIRVSGMPFFDEAGAFIGYRGVGADITELRRREQAIELLTHRYQLILDSAGDGIVELNAAGMIGFANRAAVELMQGSPGDVVGRNFAQLVGASDTDTAVIDGACTLGVAERVADALFHRLGDGRAVPVEYLAAPIMEDGKAGGAVLVFRDITMRRLYEKALSDQQAELEHLVEVRTAALSQEIRSRTRTEAQLRASRKHLKGITDSLFEGVLVVDGERLITFANPSARRLLGLGGGRLEGRPLDEVLRVECAREGDMPWLAVLAGAGVVRDDDATFVVGERRLSVAYACSPLADEGGRRGAIVSFRDIEALKAAQREAMQSSRLASVGQLAAGIAHEINTPIQYIGDNLGFIKSAMSEIVPVLEGAGGGNSDLDFVLAELPGAIDQSLDGVEQVARIVRSMKEFSHPGTTVTSAVDINRALDSTITVSRSTWKHVAAIQADFAPDLPAVQCHPGEINQVFLNLMVNAAHAIEASGKPLPGTIRVATRADGDWVEIEVADSGTGVPDDIRDRIFDPFFTTKAVGQGTGQGLSICYDVVVSKHHGQIQVGGAPGQGAVFTVRLPVGAEPAAAGYL
jgi:PAS domain S-box-containing protein